MAQQKYYVYCHRNRCNGKAYIGWTSNLKRRWRQHCLGARRGCDTVFCRALRKWGISDDVWEHEILEVMTTKEGARNAEMLWIDERCTFVDVKNSRGYNETRGGEGDCLSAKSKRKIAAGWSEERRRIASERMRNSNPMKDKETAKRVTQQLARFWTGREWTREHRENVRLSKMGSKNPNYGKPQSEEAKQKNRDAQRRRFLQKKDDIR